MENQTQNLLSPWVLASQWRSSIFFNGKMADSMDSLNTKLTRRNTYAHLWQRLSPAICTCYQKEPQSSRERKKRITENCCKQDFMCHCNLWLQESLGKITEVVAQKVEFVLLKDSSIQESVKIIQVLVQSKSWQWRNEEAVGAVARGELLEMVWRAREKKCIWQNIGRELTLFNMTL